MSKENLEQFIQQISDSEELQTRIGDEIDTESLIALGAEHGCEFTAEDLHAELSDEELDGVAGGVTVGWFGNQGWQWHHTECELTPTLNSSTSNSSTSFGRKRRVRFDVEPT